MDILENQKKQLLNDGYCIVKNFLNEEEIYNFDLSFNEKRKNKNNYIEHNEEKFWQYLTNDRLLKNLKYSLGNKIYYMHDLSINETRIEDHFRSWHRDSPCRATGIGPDWDKNFPYNVVSTITYLCSSNESNSHLNIIKGSHKHQYRSTISNILRFIHRKIHYIKSLRFLSAIIQKIIGTKLTFKSGDCVIFLANLYHMGSGVTPDNKTRKVILARYGGEGKHSENYINFFLKHRSENLNRYEGFNKKEKYFDYLSKNDIFFPLPKNKKNIEGVYSNLKNN